MRPCSSSNVSPSSPNSLSLTQATFETFQPNLHSVPSPSLLPLHLFNINHQCVATLKRQNSYTSSLVLTGDLLFTGSSNKEIQLWDHFMTPKPIQNHANQCESNTVVAGKGAVKAIVVSTNRIFTAHQDQKIRVWKIDANEGPHKFTKLATLPTLSDRACKLLLPKNQVHIRRHKKCTWVHHVDTVSALALSTDESLLYSVSWDRTLKIWGTTDFRCLESIANAHDDAINDITISNDDYIYTGSSDKKVKVWKQQPGEKKHLLVDTLEKHNSGVNALRLSTDGGVMYSGDCDGSILVWMKVPNGEKMVVVGALTGHTRSILCLEVGPDFLCSGSADNTVKIWRWVGTKFSCLAVLEGHTGPVKCITLAPDPSSSPSNAISTYTLYSASLDRDIKVWQIFLPQMTLAFEMLSGKLNLM